METENINDKIRANILETKPDRKRYNAIGKWEGNSSVLSIPMGLSLSNITGAPLRISNVTFACILPLGSLQD